MDVWLFFPRCIAGDPSTDSLTIIYLWPCINFLYVPIYYRILFQSNMCGTTLCASTRIIMLGTTFRASTTIIISSFFVSCDSTGIHVEIKISFFPNTLLCDGLARGRVFCIGCHIKWPQCIPEHFFVHNVGGYSLCFRPEFLEECPL